MVRANLLVWAMVWLTEVMLSLLLNKIFISCELDFPETEGQNGLPGVPSVEGLFTNGFPSVEPVMVVEGG